MVDLANRANVINAVVAWVVVFLTVKPERIKQLLPVSLVAIVVLFLVEQFLIYLGLIRFNAGFMKIAGIPLFHFLWAAAGGIFVMNFIKEEFGKKLPLILVFTFLAEIFQFFAVASGNFSLLGRYTYIVDIPLTFGALLVFVWLSEGLFGKRVYTTNENK